MKCIRCGYQAPSDFSQCPSCGTVQPSVSPLTASPYQINTSSKRSGGELAAIIIGIVVSVISLIAAFVIFISFLSYAAVKSLDEYGIDAVDDFDSNDYDDDLDDFFNKYYNKSNDDKSDDSVGRNTPLSFKETLFSFSAGEVDCEYEVSLLETYRVEAALKMLEGAVLPEYDTDSEDIYLVKFKIAVTEQENDAIVALPMGNPTAFPSNSVSLFSNGYECISDISYANRLSLISKGEHVETWLAFIVSKDDERPCIMWNISNSDKVFRDTQDAVDDPDAVESGTAIETEPLTESDEASADDTASGEDTPEDSQSEDSSSN